MKANTHVSARRTQAHRTSGWGERLLIGLLAALMMLMQLIPAGLAAPENAMGGGLLNR